MILADILLTPEERWKALTARDYKDRTPVHVAADFPWFSGEVSTYILSSPDTPETQDVTLVGLVAVIHGEEMIRCFDEANQCNVQYRPFIW